MVTLFAGALEEFSVAFLNSYSGYFVSEIGGDAYDFCRRLCRRGLGGFCLGIFDLFKCYRHDFATKKCCRSYSYLGSIVSCSAMAVERVTPGTSHASVSQLWC